MSTGPNCYECLYRRDLPGSAHSSCSHPSAASQDPANKVLAMLGAGRMGPIIGAGAETLGIKAKAHGVLGGWFNWPFNFDPVWLVSCSGFSSAKPAPDGSVTTPVTAPAPAAAPEVAT